MKKFNFIQIWACFVCACFVLCFSSLPARAETYTVTNTNDSGAGSLRQAISDAQESSAGADTIVFGNMTGNCQPVGGCTIDVFGGEFTINDASGALTIDNSGGARPIALKAIDGLRFFFVKDSAQLIIKNLTLRDASGYGGDSGLDGKGGAIYVGSGSAIINDSVLLNNRTDFVGTNPAGGAIFVAGGATAALNRTAVLENRSNRGAGVYNAGNLTLNNSTVADNDCVTQTTGAYSSCNGGGIYNTGSLTVNGSTVSGNTAKKEGGGLFNSGGAARAYITNTTFSGNQAGIVGLQGVRGGAIRNATVDSFVQLTNATVVFNTAVGFESVGGGISRSNSSTDDFRVMNSIVFHNTATFDSVFNNFDGRIFSGGNNLVQSDSSSFGFSTFLNDIVNQPSANLSSLGNNGGAVRTHVPLAGSPAINAGNYFCISSGFGCPNFPPPYTFNIDARGVARGATDGLADIGAVESYSVIFNQSATLPNAVAGQAYQQTLSIGGSPFAPFTFALDGSSILPAGLSLSGGGTISGTPTQTGTYTFTVRASDANTNSNEGVTTRSFQLQINNAPTAAAVSIGGRVLTAAGRGIFGATITLTDAGGNTKQARTNPFGYYRFYDAAAGATYIVQPRHKRYEFAPQVLSVAEEMNNLNFTAAQ